jgi:hypothetical protein
MHRALGHIGKPETRGEERSEIARVEGCRISGVGFGLRVTQSRDSVNLVYSLRFTVYGSGFGGTWGNLKGARGGEGGAGGGWEDRRESR